jgi:hypothetical protein
MQVVGSPSFIQFASYKIITYISDHSLALFCVDAMEVK